MDTANQEPRLAADDDPIAALARERFHIPHLAPLQRFAIANILEDAVAAEKTRRQLVLFPTGFGKSVCFQLPALLLDGITVVVYPLLALMNDQKRRLDEAALPCALFRGGLSDEEWASQEGAVRAGTARIIVANPEILAAPRLRRLLSKLEIAHLVIDEAHCIAEWGETFRPSYLSLGETANALAPSVVSAFTATAGPGIIASIEKNLFFGAAYRLVSAEADRANVLYGAVHTLSPSRTLRHLVLSCKKPAIIFDRSRPGVKMIAERLRSLGFAQARFYHAGLGRAEREGIESWFQHSDDALLVSTNAYGMGMDKKNIRTVIHTGLPDSPEAYIQEAGRGGRDGEPAAAILIDAIGREREETRGSGGETSAHGRGRSARLALYPGLAGCRREFLLKALGEEETPVCGRCDNCLESGAAGRGARIGKNDGLSAQLLRAEGFLEALVLSARHPRAYTEGEFALGLRGSLDPKAGTRGILPGWTDSELRELIEALQALGILESLKRGPWRGRIELSEKGVSYYRALRKLAR